MLNSTSDIEPSFNAFEIRRLTERCLDSVRETVFSCFVIFSESRPLLTPTAVDAIPIRPAIPARGAPATTPIPVKDAVRPADDNTTVRIPVEVANAFATDFARLYFLLICL